MAAEKPDGSLPGATGSDGDLHVAAGLELPRRRVDPECGVLGVYLRARAGGMLVGWGGVGWDVCGSEGGGGRGGTGMECRVKAGKMQRDARRNVMECI